MDSPADNERLYAACRSEGSPEQADAYSAIWPALYRVAYAMVARHPDGDALAADCAQAALIKIHRSLERCHTPARFQSWCAQVVRRTVIDELRRPDLARRASLPEDDAGAPAAEPAPEHDDPAALQALLAAAIDGGGLSDRSRRVVRGRYFAEQSDEELARAEAAISGEAVRPSHVQVTRSKNLAKLRADAALVERLREFL